MTTTTEVAIPVDHGGQMIAANLVVPDQARGVVMFAHGSGSSRHSPRNQMVAEHLQDDGYATLLLDLLTDEEEIVDASTAQWRFDIDLLARRLDDACDWLDLQPSLRDLPLGLFGASTGAAGALITAARRPQRVAAVVCRGGRPDMAAPALTAVRAPTLLIVGELDDVVINLNREAAARLPNCEVVLVAGATHLFPEPGALTQVTHLAQDWFDRHLRSGEVA
jgi:pimeloyl-ACP methyl ester carboxylesterase